MNHLVHVIGVRNPFCITQTYVAESFFSRIFRSKWPRYIWYLLARRVIDSAFFIVTSRPPAFDREGTEKYIEFATWKSNSIPSFFLHESKIKGSMTHFHRGKVMLGKKKICTIFFFLRSILTSLPNETVQKCSFLNSSTPSIVSASRRHLMKNKISGFVFRGFSSQLGRCLESQISTVR